MGDGVQGQAGVLRVDRVGDVAVIALCHPPVNTLSAAVLRALNVAIREAVDHPEIAAIILCGDGKGFSAGADLTEHGHLSPEVRLGDLCLLIENAPKPVIAALHGAAVGGGLELAMAAHYRIAAAKTYLGLPEVGFGLVSAAGGTQRLPRLIGAPDALRLLLSGLPIQAPEAMALGLVDRVVETGLQEAALSMAGEGLPPRRTADRRTGFKDIRGYLEAVRVARAEQVGNRLPAPGRIIDCVEAAAVLTLEQGLHVEAAALSDLSQTPQAAGLRYAFFAERRAALPPAAVAAKGMPKVATLGLWGLGGMACDLAFQALSAGLRVVWADPDRPALIAALEWVAARQEQAVVARQMTEEGRDADWARLVTGNAPEALAGVDMVLTAGDTGPEGAIGLGTAQGAGNQVAIAVPAAMGELAELSMTPGAGPEAVAQALALARRLGWRVVFSGPGGPIELALRQALAGAVAHLEAAGTPRSEVTAALAAYGIGSGPTSFLPPSPKGGLQTVSRCLSAMAAEGTRMLQDGRARRPLDIDAVALLSGLMPRWEGGPMYQADQRGLLVLRRDLQALAVQAEVFDPAPLLDDLIAEGQGFGSLNGV